MSDYDKLNYEVKTAKSGRKYLKITIAEYEAFLFPSKAEIAYLTALIGEKAHDDFIEG